MEYTEKYKLRQPEQKDSYDVDDFNYNSRIIDENLSKLREDHDAHAADKKNPHNVTKSQVGLDKVPNVTTNNQAPTYTEASTLETLESGEMLATAFGKIKKAITEFINHKNSKSNPHAVTKSQVGLDKVPNVTTNNQTPTFSQATQRSNVASGETLSTILGKVMRWFADLKTVAFSNDYTDLDNKPTSLKNPNALTLTMNGSASTYTGESSVSKSWYAPTYAGSSGYEIVSSGGGAPVWKAPSYAVCSAAATAVNKTVAIHNFKLAIGKTVWIKFEHENDGVTQASDGLGAVTLNISGTGEKTIVLATENGYSNLETGHSWSAGEIVEFLYDGSFWVAISSNMGFVQANGSEFASLRDEAANKKVSTTLVVGTSAAGYYPYDVNYRCTGTADQGQINSAIAALPSSGGKIVLLEGTYNLSGVITVNKPNVTIEGMGNGTVLQTSSNVSAINVRSSNCKLRNLSLTCTASDGCEKGIYVTDSYPVIENVRITHFEHNIYLNPGSDYAIVTKCHLSDGEGVCVRSKYCIISDNFIENHDWAGIYLYGPSYCNITGNILKDTGYGIFSQAAETQYNKISNNYILRGTGTSADYPSGKYTIYIVAGTYNYFSDNYIPGKNYVNNAGNTNTFTNNRYS